MAKQCGPIIFKGTIDNITGYGMNGKDYLKKKTSHDPQKVKHGKNFRGTMRYSSWFAVSSHQASLVYQPLWFPLRDKKNIYDPLMELSIVLGRKELPLPEMNLLLLIELERLVIKRRGIEAFLQWKQV